MVTVLSSSQSPTHGFFFGACSDGLPTVGSLTWLVFRQSVDLLITSPTRAPTICLPVSWVHIGRSTSTYPSQNKIETATRRKTTQKETATRSKTTGACMLERALACAPAACGCLNFFGQGSIKPTFSTCTETNQKQNKTRAKGQLRKQKTVKSTALQ